MDLKLAQFIPWLPALAAALCGICCIKPCWRRFAAPICILSIVLGFLLSVVACSHIGHEGFQIVNAFEWIRVGTPEGGLRADMSYYFDPLTIVMLFVVTGIGSLVAIYASGYMKGDKGYARFFAAVSLFIFAMTSLVMADNLVLLYLGWEGVGLCSYLLIGYYYDKPSAVAAGKKAFIVNRVGDLGFAIGIFLTFREFGTVEYAVLFEKLKHLDELHMTASMQWIPFCFMLGAFGKSAQIPLYVWLPDAMEGPTPVSALIHAATMVTAGVYMIARLLPVFQLSEAALPTVAVVGAFTAMFAATIALCQYDIKRIWAYSTISQLGYMFLGVGVASSVGGVFHLFTHAFFKALLFLTAGSVMHALAGQLDLRKMSGLRHKMPVTCWLMFVGCLALAGFPFTAGFYSKDMILAAAMDRGINDNIPLFKILAGMGVLTAFLTAYYTFRVWFRVFMGPERYEMGHENHADEHGHDDHQTHDDHHAHEPHEMSWLMNGPLVVLAIGAIVAGFACERWIEEMVNGSSARVVHESDERIHHVMMIVSSLVALAGIVLSWYLHLYRRDAADRTAARNREVVRLLENKYYVDELYDALIVRPLRRLGNVFFAIDQLIIDGVVLLVGTLPRILGLSVQPTQQGLLQGYGVGMLGGIVLLILILLFAM